MQIVFISNYLNHHQFFLCNALLSQPNVTFYFIETEKVPEYRLNIGWTEYDEKFLVKAYENKHYALELCRTCDIIIIGSAPAYYLSKPQNNNRTVFAYSERLFKEGYFHYKYMARFFKYCFRNKYYRNAYLLCAGAFAAQDYRMIGLFKNRVFKWGYFPEVKEYQNVEDIIELKNHFSILWAGRLIRTKHPDSCIRLANRLREQGYDFSVKIIGDGELYESLRIMIEENNLSDRIQLLGAKNPTEVRKHMEESEVFLFTSDQNEGWGAVLNESMNSACAVVANDRIGSVPYLLKDGENGYSYHNGDEEELFEKVKFLLDNPSRRLEISKAAYDTMIHSWNAKTAASRLVDLSKSIKEGTPCLFEEGPCSKG